MRSLFLTLAAFLCMVDAALAGPGASMIPEAKCTDVVWGLREQLSNVQTDSVILSLMTEAASDLKVEWGTTSRVYTDSAENLAVAAETMIELEMDSLSAGTRYYYRAACRLDGQTKWGYGGEYNFKTLETSTDATVKFAVEADGHIAPAWIGAGCGDGTDEDYDKVAEFRQTMRNIVARQPDWMVSLGDEFSPHCPSCNDECFTRGQSTGTEAAASAAIAGARYEIGLREWHLATRFIPFFLTLGNHEGETGYGNTEADCGHTDTLDGFAETARLAYIPNPADVYDNDAAVTQGNAFTWTSGAAQFWILDAFKFYPTPGGGVERAPSVGTCSGSPPGSEDCVRGYPNPDVHCEGVETCDADASLTFPTFAADWTLGTDQFDWFETTIEASNAKWKFVFIHHLLGGAGSIEGTGKDQTGTPWAGGACSHYGRGLNGAVTQYCSVTVATTCLNDADCPGVETCVAIDITDPFKGEWESIHTLLKNNIDGGGSNWVFAGHDHVWVTGPAKDGVHYLMTPHPQGGRVGWADTQWFMDLYDYDNDSTPEYDDATGGDENGFYLVTVNGETSVQVQMIKTDIVTPASNNTVIGTYP